MPVYMLHMFTYINVHVYDMYIQVHKFKFRLGVMNLVQTCTDMSVPCLGTYVPFCHILSRVVGLGFQMMMAE